MRKALFAVVLLGVLGFGGYKLYDLYFGKKDAKGAVSGYNLPDGLVTCYDRSLKNAAKGEAAEYDAVLEHRKALRSVAQQKKSNLTIPKITHHSWLVDSKNPKELNDKDFEYVKKTILMTPDSGGWQHMFWTNDKNLIPRTVERLSSLGVIIKEVRQETIKDFVGIKKEYLKAFDYNLSMPNDVLSYAVLQEYGGVYFDVDYELKAPLDDLITKYSFLAHEEPSTMYIGHAIIAAPPAHPVVMEALRMIRRNFSSSAPDYVLFACHDRAFTVSAAGPAMLSLAFYNRASNEGDFNDYFLTDNDDLYDDKIQPSHNKIGIHHGSDTWSKAGERGWYKHCRQCIR